MKRTLTSLAVASMLNALVLALPKPQPRKPAHICLPQQPCWNCNYNWAQLGGIAEPNSHCYMFRHEPLDLAQRGCTQHSAQYALAKAKETPL